MWHVWWPSSGDPFYNHNPQPVNARVSFYGMNFTPDVTVDGSGAGNGGPDPFSYSSMANAINNRLAIPAPLGVTLTGNINGSGPGATVDIDVDIDVETAQAGTHRLYVALVEKHIFLPSPNGETDHYNTFRQLNGNSAQTIDLSSTGVQHFDIQLPFDPIYQEDEMRIIAWVQNASTREVLNAGRSDAILAYASAMEYNGADTQIGTASEITSYAGTMQNVGVNPDTYDITVTGVPAGWTYSYTTPAGTFSGPSTLSLASMESAPFTLDLDSQGMGGTATVTIEMQSQNATATHSELQFTKLNNAKVVLIDDDNGDEREEPIESSLTAAGVIWGTVSREDGTYTTADLQTAAQVVIWNCGSGASAANPTLDADDRAALGALLDAGGRVWVAGGDVSYDLANPASPNYTAATEQWHNDYLHVTHVSDSAGATIVQGVAGDPIGDALIFGIAGVGPYGQASPDAITPGTGADPVFNYFGQSTQAAARWSGGGARVYFQAFGIEGMSADSSRDEVVDRAVTWLCENVTGIDSPAAIAPRIALAQNVPNPFRTGGTTIRYELAAAGQVSLAVYDVAGRIVRNLVNAQRAAEVHTAEWDGRDDQGHLVSNGVYFYKLEAPGVSETRRMVLQR